MHSAVVVGCRGGGGGGGGGGGCERARGKKGRPCRAARGGAGKLNWDDYDARGLRRGLRLGLLQAAAGARALGGGGDDRQEECARCARGRARHGRAAGSRLGARLKGRCGPWMRPTSQKWMKGGAVARRRPSKARYAAWTGPWIWRSPRGGRLLSMQWMGMGSKQLCGAFLALCPPKRQLDGNCTPRPWPTLPELHPSKVTACAPPARRALLLRPGPRAPPRSPRPSHAPRPACATATRR
jgi:hypothetical protein